MHTDPMEVSGFSGKLKYVDSCPNQLVPGKALCRRHCDEAEKKGIPTGIKEQEPTFIENNDQEDIEVPL